MPERKDSEPSLEVPEGDEVEGPDITGADADAADEESHAPEPEDEQAGPEPGTAGKRHLNWRRVARESPDAPPFARVTPWTIALVVVFIISAVALLGVINLRVFTDYFEGGAFFWILRIGIGVMIASLVVYLVFREKSGLDYVEGLLEKRMETNSRLRLLLQAGRDVSATLDMAQILEKGLDYAAAATDAVMGAVYLKPKNEEVLRLEMVTGVDDQKMIFRELPIGKGGLIGRATDSLEIVETGDMTEIDERENAFFGAETPGSQVIVPLAPRDRLLGVMITATSAPHDYSDEEKRTLDGFAEITGLAIINAELYRIARTSLDKLARQRGLTESVLEEMVAGVIIADRNGRIDVFNREAQKLTGFTLAEKAQARLRPELDIDDNPFGPLEHVMLEVLRTAPAVREGEALIMKKDRTLLPISYRVYPLADDGEVLGVAAVFMTSGDITRDNARTESVDYQVLLRSLGARIERLYTHPLSRVLDHVRNMEIDAWAQSRGDMTRTLEAGSAALLELLEDVEQYLNCVTVREWDQQVENDVSEIVGEVVEKVLKTRESAGVVVLVRLAGLPPAFGYTRMVKSALEEVIENAVIAAAEGDKKVEVTGREAGGFVHVEVRDTGPGVSNEARDYMYLPFFTSLEGRPGLGLSIVHRVMKKLGGRVDLAKPEGVGGTEAGGARGATFILAFPTAPHAGGGEAPGGEEEREGGETGLPDVPGADED